MKTVDSRLNAVIEQCAELSTRFLLIIKSADESINEQIMIVHHLISKATKKKQSVLWCHSKDSEVPRQSRKKLKKLEKRIKSGQTDVSKENAYELFLLSTSIKYCSYGDSQQVLGQTHGMCVIQDVEDLTPNVLCRVCETVSGGGAVVVLLPGTSSLRDLFELPMNVHSKLRTHMYPTVTPLFNKRMVISYGWCSTCLVVNENLCVEDELPPCSTSNNKSITSKISNKLIENKTQLEEIKSNLADADKPLPQLIELCKTIDQTQAVLKMIDVVTEKLIRATVSLTAGRGRGKSAALGISVAAAVHYGVTNIFVVSPSPQNLTTFFEFVFKGFDAMEYEDSTDYEIIQSTNPDYHKAIIRVNIFRKYRQVIQYVDPSDACKIGQAELVIIDEAAAIPLPKVKAFFGNHNVFLASTTNGYEGTGRSLSLKLLQQLRQQSVVSAAVDDKVTQAMSLHEVTLEESIRYSDGDSVEDWMYKLLCLDAATSFTITTTCPPPTSCSLYYVNREVLLSGHRESEDFMHQVMSLLVASHYRNSPDDLQILSDAPAHHLFVLLPPVTQNSSTLPPVLCVIQACLEGGIPKKVAQKALNKGDRPCGDLIPWTLSSQFSQSEFAELKGLRIVRIATHPEYQSMGYGIRAMTLLNDYYCKKFISLEEKSSKVNITFKQNETEDNTYIVPEDIEIPLLAKLNERDPEELDYLGVSYGITPPLFKFWKKCGFKPVYISQVQNKTTGEHSCVMVKSITGPTDDDEPESTWLETQSKEFIRRYIGLLPSQLNDLPLTLALNIIQSHSTNASEAITWKELKNLITGHDIQRLEKYSKNLADRYLIADILPIIAKLFFTGRLQSVNLSTLQSNILLSIGLQHHSMDKISNDLDLPMASALGQFNRALKRLLTALNEVQEDAISKHLPEAPREFIPVAISLDQELEDAAQDYEKQSKLKKTIFGDLTKYSVQGSNEDWKGAINSNLNGNTISIKSKKRPVKMTDQELEQELNEPTKKKKKSKDLSVKIKSNKKLKGRK